MGWEPFSETALKFQIMSVSRFTCTVQSDSLQENHMLVVLGKEDGKVGVCVFVYNCGMTVTGGTPGGGDEGRGMGGSKT